MNFKIENCEHPIFGSFESVIVERENGSFESFPVDENNPRYIQFLAEQETA